MPKKPNLLVKDNLIRHLSSKTKKLRDISDFIHAIDEQPILESILAISVSYFEAAIIDTVREYVYANPDEIYDLMLQKFDIKIFNKDIQIIELKGFDDYITEAFLDKIAFYGHKSKIKKLTELTGIDMQFGDDRWERINELIARRNCLIHNDLIANNTYFKQAGRKSENISQGGKLPVTVQYLSNRIGDLNSLLEEVKNKLDIAYKDRTTVVAVKSLWDYLFENHYPFSFESCWDTDGGLITYKGPSPEEIEFSSSPRMVCLFSAWMSLFGYLYNGDMKHFSEIFHLDAKERKMYTKKLKFLMDSFEKIDFQGFGVKVYDKST